MPGSPKPESRTRSADPVGPGTKVPRRSGPLACRIPCRSMRRLMPGTLWPGGGVGGNRAFKILLPDGVRLLGILLPESGMLEEVHRVVPFADGRKRVPAGEDPAQRRCRRPRLKT